MLRGWIFKRYEDPEASRGAAAPATAPAPSTGGDPGSNATGGAAAGGQPAAQSGEGDQQDTPKFTQKQMDETVQKRLAEEKARADKRAADEKKKSDDAKLAADAKWQELANSREAEIATLKPAAERAETLATRMNAIVDAEIASWPQEVKDLDPGAGDIEARLTWLEKSRALAARLKGTAAAPSTEAGNRGNAMPAPGQGQQNSAKPAAPAQGYKFQGPNDVRW